MPVVCDANNTMMGPNIVGLTAEHMKTRRTYEITVIQLVFHVLSL